jgi:hypothetical protein
MAASEANSWVRETRISLLTEIMSIIFMWKIPVIEDSASNISQFGNKIQNIGENNAGVKEVSFSDTNEVEYHWERLWRTK